MSIRHLLLLSCLIAPNAAPALAQQAAQPTPNKFPVAPLLGSPTPTPDWHTQIPTFRPNAPTSLQTQPLPTLNSHTISRLRASRQPQLLAQNNLQAATRRLLAQNDSTCYVIRDYQFKQDDSTSDTPHLSGYTTCVPRSTIQEKQAGAARLRLLR